MRPILSHLVAAVVVICHPRLRKDDLQSTSLIVWSTTIEAMAQKATRSSTIAKQAESSTASLKEEAVFESGSSGENANSTDDVTDLATDSATLLEVTIDQSRIEMGNSVLLLNLL